MERKYHKTSFGGSEIRYVLATRFGILIVNPFPQQNNILGASIISSILARFGLQQINKINNKVKGV